MSATTITGADLRDAGAALALNAEADKDALQDALEATARTFPEFTSDELWVELQQRGIYDLTHPNAMGAAFLAAAKAGTIEPTDKVRRSSRAAAHRRKVTLWKSLIFRGEA